ncbi:MAG TPA: ATP-binding protein [Rhodanobacteraceae bacterium]|jgi:two-component system sensor histidine kinase QseC|nr:ATP-binding protein [Rhodanobacteraceae bacterium]
MQSLNARISALVLASIALVLLPFAFSSYAKIMEEVDELSDARLAQNARTIDLLALDTSHGAAVVDSPEEVENWQGPRGSPVLTVHGHKYEMQIGFQYWTSGNQLRLTSHNLRDLPLDAAPAGFADIAIGERRWRVFTLLGSDRGWVRVAERYDSRREIGRALAFESAAPLVIGVPLLAFLAGAAVRRGLRPLRELAERLTARRPDEAGPVGFAGIPREVEPVVASLNVMLRRLRALLEHERQFTADAAHELRTPLAGAVVHIENAMAERDPTIAKRALAEARDSIVGLSRTVNQMLELARWDAGPTQPAVQAVDLAECVQAELQEIGGAAADKDLELVVNADPNAPRIQGWQPGLHVLIRNLIENAIHHSPHRGRIEIRILARDGGTVLTVSDEGEGIAADQRVAMLARFRRGAESSEGSGLGLAIVARIAEVHGAKIVLENAARGGLVVEVAFPRGPHQV